MPGKEIKMNKNFGSEFWADARLCEDEDGYRTFAKDGYHCWCPPGVEPGDADSEVREDNTMEKVA